MHRAHSWVSAPSLDLPLGRRAGSHHTPIASLLMFFPLPGTLRNLLLIAVVAILQGQPQMLAMNWSNHSFLHSANIY